MKMFLKVQSDRNKIKFNLQKKINVKAPCIVPSFFFMPP